MHRSLVPTISIILVTLIVLVPILSANAQDGDPPQFFRTVKISTVQVISTVNIRRGAGIDQEIVRQALPSETFEIRDGIPSEEHDGYTWIPVTVDSEVVWIAKGGFIREISESVEVPITSDEVAMVYAADLPQGAVKLTAQDGNLYATNETGEMTAVWTWGDEPGGGYWIAMLNRAFNPPEVVGVDGLTWSDQYGGYIRDGGSGEQFVVRAALQGEDGRYSGNSRILDEIITDSFGTITLETPTDETWLHTNGSFRGDYVPIFANAESISPHYFESRIFELGGVDYLKATPENMENGWHYFFIRTLLNQTDPNTGANFTQPKAEAWLRDAQSIPITLITDNRSVHRGDGAALSYLLETRLVDPRAGVSIVFLPQFDVGPGGYDTPHELYYPAIGHSQSVGHLGSDETFVAWGFEVTENGRLVLYLFYVSSIYGMGSREGTHTNPGVNHGLGTMFWSLLHKLSTAHSGVPDKIPDYSNYLIRAGFSEVNDETYDIQEAFGRNWYTYNDQQLLAGILFAEVGYPIDE